MPSRSLFVPANHMLVLYCVLYAVGDLLRAFWFESDSSDDAQAISVIFFLLALWLTANAVLYYRAFLDEMDAAAEMEQDGAGGRNARSGTHCIEGTGVSMALAEAAANGAVGIATGTAPSDVDLAMAPSASDSRSSSEPSRQGSRRAAVGWGSGWRGTWQRWTFYLNTEAGIAYALNILGSLGYVVSSLISMFLTVNSVGTARQIDKASLFLDCINMVVFIIDGVLFFHVWWKENAATTFKGKMRSVYFWGNLCNTLSSIAYLCFVAWSLRQRYRLEEDERARHLPPTDHGRWYDDELIDVTFRQRSLYFAADLVYLVYALLLEIGWWWEHEETDQLQSRLDAASKRKEAQQQQDNGIA